MYASSTMCLHGVTVCLFVTLFFQVNGQICLGAEYIIQHGVRVMHTVPVCCSGHEGHYGADGGFYCPNLNQLHACSGPNACKCNNQHINDVLNPHSCIRICSPGYYYSFGHCQHICFKTCHGAKCLEPARCACEPGWVINDLGDCIPICSPECGNGNCVDVNKCSCWNGYELRENSRPQCVFKCDTGYERVEGVCKPHCSKPCRGGYCSAPEECSCHRGWEMNGRRECISTCNLECGNGTCVENKCVCENGYELREEASPKCIPSCRDCHGECVAPDKCRCKEPYKTVYLTGDNLNCDCHDDCDTKCSKTTCLEISTSINTPVLPKANDTTAYNDSNEMVEPKLSIVYHRIPATNSRKLEENNTIWINDDAKYIIWLTICCVTATISIILIILIIWELKK